MFRTCCPNIKHLKLSALFILSPLYFFAQTLTGLWTGVLSNDSNTVRKDQTFEIALTEYRGKVYGYSRSEFIVNDTLYYILKRVKGTIAGDICEVTDDDIISYNFRGKLDKGVKVTSTFRRNQTDSTWYLEGTWKTNVTRKYYAVTGKVGLQEEKDLNASKIFPHLEELNLANDIAFYKERKEGPVIVKVAHPEKIKTEYNDRPQPILISNDISVVPVQPNLQKAETVPVSITSGVTGVEIAEVEPKPELHAEKKPVAVLPGNEIKTIPATVVSITPSPVTKTIAEPIKPGEVSTPDNSITSVATTPVSGKNETRPDDVVGHKKSEPFAKTVAKQEQPVFNNELSAVKQPAAMVDKPDSKSVAINNSVPEKKANSTIDPTSQKKSEPLAKTVAKQEQPVVKTETSAVKEPAAMVDKPDSKSVAINNPVPEKKANSTIDPTTQKKSEPIAKAIANQPDVKTQPSTIKQPAAMVDKPDSKSVAINNPVPEKKANSIIDPTTQKKSEPIAKTVVKQEQPVAKIQPTQTKQPVAIINNPGINTVATRNPVPEKKQAEPVVTPIVQEPVKPIVDVTVKAAVIEGRKSEFSQIVNFKADSLELSLYDNGEIDGDTVSIFMNGDVLLSRQGLKSSAIKKTIYITPGNEEFTLVMFAENLGKYPPNTGLLVVHDGDDVYNIRFSSDMKKSSGIVFRKKR